MCENRHTSLCKRESARNNAKVRNVVLAQNNGCYKELVVERPKAGKWFISVYCTTAVDSFVDELGTTYVGRTDVLNGVPYSIKATLF